MTLSTITDKQGRNISEVYVLEKGQAVKYVEFTARDYPLAYLLMTLTTVANPSLSLTIRK